jgi:hypothetical protein
VSHSKGGCPGGASGTLKDETRKSPQGLRSGNTIGEPDVPSRDVRHEHPYGIRSWKCLSTRVSPLIASVSPFAMRNSTMYVPSFFRTVDHDPVFACYRRFLLPHSSSSARFTAGAFAFFILSQSGERPER